MYSWELEQYIQERHYELRPEECRFVMNISNSPQIVGIRYYTGNSNYIIETNDGYCLSFSVKSD